MRVTGGILRGRRILAPKRDVRPTQDKVKEALFSILGPRVSGVRFLDAFAGSGAVGIEAWSRGASHVCWVESDPKTVQVIQSNNETLCDSEGEVVQADALRYLKERIARDPFDIVFLDPPYDFFSKTVNETPSMVGRLLEAVQTGGMLAADGVVLIEQPDGTPLAELQGWEVVQDRRYGATSIRFYKSSTSTGSTGSPRADSGPA